MNKILTTTSMVAVAQLVRAPDCGSGGRGFETHQPPIYVNFYYNNKGLI